MARGNDGSSGNFIDLGDITAARFERAETWTALAFFNLSASTPDDSAFITKYASGVSQFLFRTDNQAAPTNVEVGHGNDTAVIINGASSIELNTWYLSAVICDGTSSAGDITLYTLGMDGTVIDDGVTGDSNPDESNLTTPVRLMTRTSTADELNGSMAHAAYIRSVLTKQDVFDYLYQPAKVVAKFKGVGNGVPFYQPLGLGSPEPDFSGSSNNGTVTGTPTITDNPPIAPWYGFDLGWQGAFTAAVGGVNAPTADLKGPLFGPLAGPI